MTDVEKVSAYMKVLKRAKENITPEQIACNFLANKTCDTCLLSCRWEGGTCLAWEPSIFTANVSGIYSFEIKKKME